MSLWGAKAVMVVMLSVLTPSGARKEATTMEMYVTAENVRMNTKGKDQDSSVIFRKDKELFWMADNKDKKYTEVTKKDIDAMAKQMEEAMAGMDPVQRKMMEGMMGGKKEVPKIVYKKIGSGEKVGQWTCDHYEGLQDGKKVVEVWTTEPKDLGFDEKSLKGLEEMAKFFEGFMSRFGQATVFQQKPGSEAWEKEGGFRGMPVKTVHYVKGKAGDTWEVREVRSDTPDAALFEEPKGYKKDVMKPDAKDKAEKAEKAEKEEKEEGKEAKKSVRKKLLGW